jgi:hypothetical protein
VYAVKDGDARPIVRKTPMRQGHPGVIWCPWCDHSTQDVRSECAKCGAEFTAELTVDLTGIEPRELSKEDVEAFLNTLPTGTMEVSGIWMCACGHKLTSHSKKGCSYRRHCGCEVTG